MSYETWNTYGYGICVDDIETTAEKLLKVASMNENVLKNVREYLEEIYPNGYKDKDLTLDDFEGLEGDYCEHGIAYVLYQVIDDFTDDDFVFVQRDEKLVDKAYKTTSYLKDVWAHFKKNKGAILGLIIIVLIILLVGLFIILIFCLIFHLILLTPFGAMPFDDNSVFTSVLPTASFLPNHFH